MATERIESGVSLLQVNPFEVTKAVDFTDQEIDTMWVDWPAPGGFAEFMSIRSPMARIIRGGKGTGRTHVMRHFSARVQTIRGNGNAIEQMHRDGVLGIYVRCSGLNSARFQGRGIDSDTWSVIFAQYMDIWLAQSAIEAFQIVFQSKPLSEEIQESIVDEVWGIIQTQHALSDKSFNGLSRRLFEMQRQIDSAVNNAALRRAADLQVDISTVPGALVYGVPDALKHHYTPMENITCLYLIDEFENFELEQQKYVNSLIREKPPGTSFVVGVRTYGLKTLEVIAGGEENRPGSEFEWIDPDQYYSVARGTRSYGTYREFCSKVVARRLAKHGSFDDEESENRHERLKSFFEMPPPDNEERLICEQFDPLERPYLNRLKEELRDYAKNADGTPLRISDVDFIIEAVSVPSRPLLEKANALLIYQTWSQGKDLNEAAKEILSEVAAVPTYPERPTPTQARLLEKYRSDFKAQLCNDLRIAQNYCGLDRFIEMSDGLPRNLLVIMKYVHRWALFNEEKPFQEGQISLDSQMRGLLDAAAWFLDDAKPLGNEGDNVIDAVGRLCNMFRRLRMADKLVESSLTTFSADLTKCSERARQIVKLAEQWSLLMRVEGGQKERSSKLIEHKYQVNRLLSPRWDLPTARRGAIRLNPDEMNAIFDPGKAHNFGRILNQRLGRMEVPFGRQHIEDGARRLFDLEGHEIEQ